MSVSIMLMDLYKIVVVFSMHKPQFSPISHYRTLKLEYLEQICEIHSTESYMSLKQELFG
jgi:hypothetical protein